MPQGDTQTVDAPARVAPSSRWVPVVFSVLAISFLLGAVTSYAQGWLPDALSSFANSASGWAILTAVGVTAARPSLALGAVLGAGSFVLLVLGYTAASEWRGLSYSPWLWGGIGVVTGPVIGAAAAAVRDARPSLAALGSGLLGAVLLVDAGYGLTVIGDTTSPVYWSLVAVLGIALLAVIALRVLLPAPKGRRLVALQLGTVATVAALGALGYVALSNRLLLSALLGG